MKILPLFLLILILLLALTRPVIGQAYAQHSNPLAKFITHTQGETWADALLIPLLPVPAPGNDSLTAKRHSLTTSIYQNNVRLSSDSIRKTLQLLPKSRNQFHWATLLKPVGPLVALSGIAVGYIGVKGVPASAVIRGKRTATTPNPPSEQVTYTKRNLPVLLAGVGLFVGGICLIELSNELMVKAVKPYNAKVGMQRKAAFLYNTQFGITPEGNLGFYARF